MTVYRGWYPHRHRARRIALAVVLTALIMAVAVSSGLYAYGRLLNRNLDRVDAIPPDAGSTPARTEGSASAASGPLDILVVGTDSRDPDRTGSRADTIILAHVDGAHEHVYLSSIARDTWVEIPPSGDGRFGGGVEKINAAFAYGGPELLVRAVQQYTGVHIDHFVMVDFAGFQQVVDAIGGVDLTVEKTITSIHGRQRVFVKGRHHFTGGEALDYVRQRKQFADGDFARQRHQHELIAALMDKLASGGTLGDPAKLNATLQSVTRAVTVDRSFDLVQTAVSLRNLRSDDLIFMTSPNSGTAMIGGQSVVLPDTVRARGLYRAFADDTVAAYLSTSASPTPAVRGR